MFAGGDKFAVTPTYHVFDMFKEHQGGNALRTLISDNTDIHSRISASASEKDGIITLTLANLSCDNDETVDISLLGISSNISGITASILTSDDIHAHNTFDAPERVKPHETNVDIASPFTLPKASIISLSIRTNQI